MSLASLDPTAEPWRRNLGRTDDARLRGPRGDWWWTGKAPAQAPGLGPDGRLTSLPLLDLSQATRREIQAYFDNAWTLTEVLFSALATEEAFYRPPTHRLRHPLVFYYGHPATLYVNKLRVAGVLTGPVNAEFERLFETGVDEMSWDDMSKNDEPWPSIDEVLAYRQAVYGLVTDVITRQPGLSPGASFGARHEANDAAGGGGLLWALAMAFEHERIHLETSSVLIRELPLELVQEPAAWPAAHAAGGPAAPPEAAAPTLVAIAGGPLELGKPADFPTFGWDNEYGADRRDVAPFEAAETLVSNGEFHAFVAEGGYRDPRWWSEAGWGWRAFRNVKWPTFWVPTGPAGSHEFALRLPFAEVPMPWDWPVEVNWHEAKAYAAWRSARDGRSYRLPTEGEHLAMRDAGDRFAREVVEMDPVLVADGREMAARGRNLNLAWGSPRPVAAGERSDAGVYDAMGNVWTWCEAEVHPLPGFRLDPFYDDFSAPCFDGEHQMILGGSFVSTGDEASVWARFHFRPHFHQFAGIRLVVGERCDAIRVGRRGEAIAALVGQNPYESRKLVDEYLLMHHGAAADVMPWAFGPTDGLNFAQRCAALVSETHQGPRARALDLGCAVGGASFELAKAFGEVLGVDWSQAFVQAASELATTGEARYFLRTSGDAGEERAIAIDPAIDRTRVRFERGDAHAPAASWGSFDAVLMGNLIDRLRNPATCLGRLAELVRPGGTLVITTPFTWLDEYTPRDRWLDGLTGVQAVLDGAFELVETRDMPFVIREHARKFQWSVAQASVWRRRA